MCRQSEMEIALARELVSEVDGAPLFFPGSLDNGPTRTVDLARTLVDASASIQSLSGQENRSLSKLSGALQRLPHVQQALRPSWVRCNFGGWEARSQGHGAWQQLVVNDHAVLAAERH